MTYCIGLKLDAGLVLLSDTRTNAGLDNIARFRKMFTWSVPGERVMALLTAGNLSITQGVVSRLNKAIAIAEEATPDGTGSPEVPETILNAETLFRCAQIVGQTMREMQDSHRREIVEQGADADASVLLAGQRADGRHRLYLIYAAGNFIEATADTPFFQLGEHKYGKPILDRIITPKTPIETALKAAMVSMDSTLRSNLSVGMPLDLLVIREGLLEFAINRRIAASDPEFQAISRTWSDALHHAFESLPDVTMEG
ncbi:MAG: peptidase [Pseudomonadota bacterium]